MKTCRNCFLAKVDGEFPRRGSSPDGLAPWCKSCSKRYAAEYYRRHADRLRQAKRDNAEGSRLSAGRARAVRRRWLDSIKAGRPCADCDHVYPPYVMDFDHRDRSTKLFCVSTCYGTRPKDAILAEIAKCDLVCSNCHRERTYGPRLRLVVSSI